MVDVIIPIYNAYEAVQECLGSIIRNTDLVKNRIILINDQSTDERIQPYLDQFIAKYNDKNIILLSNESNLGFVGTVNKGMRYSMNDVILLNSDTEVPKNWIENMEKCAYSQKDVASVTALSNNATLASVPHGLQPNSIPNSMTFDEYAELVEKTSFCRYPEIPTAHGFCMYIRRDVLNVVGGFDEETFGKGYGEENDFSYRCLDFGYKHLLCDNVIILHKESQSFNESKTALIENNSQLLKIKFPLHTLETDNWCSRFPIMDICNNILIQANNNKHPNILFIIHDWSNINANVGGTTLHCLDIINQLKNKYNFHVFAPENGGYRLYSYFENDECVIDLGTFTSYNTKSKYNNEYKKLLETIIDAFDISYVHVHHMIGHYFDIIDVCKEKDISNAITLHDFYCICPTINLLYNSKEFCLNLCEKDCVLCLRNQCKIATDITYDWKSTWRKYLIQFDHVIVPSQSTRDIIDSQIDGLQIEVVEHGVNIEKHKTQMKNEAKTFNIAFLGVLTNHKGSNHFKYLVDHMDDKKVTFHLFGKSEIKHFSKSFKNFIYHGPYKRSEIYSLLKNNNIDLVCNLAICPETYSYTLTETIASGVPVISFDLGAVAERIKKYNLGWTVDTNDDQLLLNKLKWIIDNRNHYNEVIDSINSYSIKSVEEMSDDYDNFYIDSHESSIQTDCLKKLLKRKGDYFPTNIDLETQRILNSKKWKIVSRLHVPNRLVKILRKLLRK